MICGDETQPHDSQQNARIPDDADTYARAYNIGYSDWRRRLTDNEEKHGGNVIWQREKSQSF